MTSRLKSSLIVPLRGSGTKSTNWRHYSLKGGRSMPTTFRPREKLLRPQWLEQLERLSLSITGARINGWELALRSPRSATDATLF